MKNKYLITVIIPELEMEFDMYVPNNKKIGTIKECILKSISELSDNTFVKTANEVRMFNRETGIDYDNDIFVKDSNIRNGSRIILM